jgi:hypothetical protein
MSEMGPVRASYEIDRLADLAASLGYVRAEAELNPKPAAPGSIDKDVQRYVDLAGELGLTGSTDYGLPSLGR